MRRDENQNVEYKESWNDKYLEWICGYANAKGGTLYIGIKDKTKRVVGVRARYSESSLADHYDPLTMPPDLRAVLAAYGLAPDTPEPEIVAHLF